MSVIRIFIFSLLFVSCGQDILSQSSKNTSSGSQSIVSPDNSEETSCVCTMQYAPVCGVDKKTYGNSCQAGCSNVAIDYEGACK